MAASPWIDLKRYGAVGATGKILKTNAYINLPVRNYIFFGWGMQWYPELCPQTGKLITSPWITGPVFYYPGPGGASLQCTSTAPGTLGIQLDYSGICPANAEKVRIALGVFSYCLFFFDCTHVSNTSPWFDEVGLGVYNYSSTPFIFADEMDRAQDNFPENGTLNFYATGRVDCNNIQGFPARSGDHVGRHAGCHRGGREC